MPIPKPLRRLVFALPLLTLLCLSPSAAVAAEEQIPQVKKLRSIAPEDHRFNDLAAFGRAVGDAQVVVLGEQTHGEAEVFSLKARLAEYLHEKKGFDVLLLESGLFDGETIAQRSAQGESVLQLAPGNLFFAYSKTVQARTVFSYIDAQRQAGTPLTLATFDSQQSGKLSQTLLVDSLGAYLSAEGSVLPQSEEWQLFRERSNAVLKFDRSEPPANEQATYFQFIDQINQCLNVVDKPELQPEAPFWRREVASLQSQARRFWGTRGDIAANRNMREAAGADNMVWQIRDAHPGHKVIVWTYDGHGQKAPLFGEMKGSMQRVREILPETRFYHVYFTSYAGQFVNFESGAAVDVGKRAPESIETRLHDAGIKLGFVDLQTATPAIRALPLDSHTDGFQPNHPALADFTDGVFYIDTIHPTTREKGFEQ